MQKAHYHVLGIGNAIVDVLWQTDDDFLVRHGLAKGSMTLIEAEAAERLYADMGEAIESSGGSVANSMAGLASLGARGCYVGKVRDDQLGQIFRHDIRAIGVDFPTAPAIAGPPTARCLVLVTPDAQRTMCTYLGASTALGPEDVDEALVAAAEITYLEGYLWDPPRAKEAFLKAMRAAHAAGRRVALSLSDRFCVKRYREEFLELVDNHVDILFANEHEAMALFQVEDFAAAVAALNGRVPIAALTRSAAGSTVLSDGETTVVAAERLGQVIDTTGAGDLYAAGFLYGLTHGRQAADCGRIASLAAAEAISHLGARPRRNLKQLVAQFR
ncbi:MAG: adenosine kinase [Alphaproteobacteria bacterium]|nr:adenosine kinase [Alphaproteobacteria bacterium]